MSVDNDDVKTGAVVVGEIIKAAGDNPNVKEAGENFGQAALTISKTVKNVLLPLAAVNYGIEKAQKYFTGQFTKELEDKTKDIDQEDIIEPKASIAGPALQGLAFTHEEESLKDMYLSLLATSMDSKTAGDAHPAFVEIIRQLTSEEANLLKLLLPSQRFIAICEVRLKKKGKQEWLPLLKHLIDVTDDNTDKPIVLERLSSMIENFVRLGLVEVQYGKSVADEKAYSWMHERPEVKKLQMENKEENTEIVFERGFIRRTDFGEQFAKAVDMTTI